MERPGSPRPIFSVWRPDTSAQLAMLDECGSRRRPTPERRVPFKLRRCAAGAGAPIAAHAPSPVMTPPYRTHKAQGAQKPRAVGGSPRACARAVGVQWTRRANGPAVRQARPPKHEAEGKNPITGCLHEETPSSSSRFLIRVYVSELRNRFRSEHKRLECVTVSLFIKNNKPVGSQC